jgi:hypothetical protein
MADDNKDIEQKVKITYDTNAQKTAKDVNVLDDSIGKVDNSQKEAIKTNKKVKKSQDETSKGSKDQKKGLEDLGGGIGGAIKGFKALLKSMWAIVTNPLGLILVAIVGTLTLLFKAFISTKAGAEKFDQIMAGLGATIDVLRDRVLNIGSAIVKFFSGDFSGAVAEGRAAVSGFGVEVALEFKKAADATRSLQEVADSMRDLSVTRAELDRDLAESERILTDINATYKEKQTALAEVEKAEKKQTDAELDNARKKLAAILELNKLSDSGDEDLDAAAEAQIAVIELEKKSSENRRKVADFNKTLAGEEQTRVKELTDARKAAAAERANIAEEEIKKIAAIAKLELDTETAALRALQDLNDKTEEEKLARKKERDLEAISLLEQQGVDVRNLLIYNDELYNTLEDELREKRAEEKDEQDEADREKKRLAGEKDIKIQEEKAAKEKSIEDAKLAQAKAIEDAKSALLSDGLNALKNIFSKNKKIQKGILIAENAAALAKITMNTVEAVSKDNAASPLTFGMPWSGIHIAQGAIGAANVIASTARGLKELGGGSAGTAPSMGATPGATSAAPSVDFQASSENQIATSIANNTNETPVVKAIVVSKDVTDAQEADRNKVDSNSLG